MSTIDKASLIQIPSGYKNGKLYSVKPTPSYGSELVTNGGFDTDTDWSKGAGWSISGGKATHTGSQSLLSQSNVLTIGKKYKISFDLQNADSLNYVRLLTSHYPNGGNFSTNGTIVIYTNTNITQFYIYGVGDVSIDNVSVKEVLNDGDFDFSRSSSATRVNSEGLIEVASVLGSEEIVNGDFATDSDWIKGSGWTISGDKANCDGSQLSVSDLQQNYDFSDGIRYKLTFDIIVTNGSITPYIGGVNTTSVTSTETNVTRYVIAGSSNHIKLRASSDFIGSIDNVSVKEVIENDVPRLDYSGGASCASLLLEPQATNLVTQSEDFSGYSGGTATIVINQATAPDGATSADKIYPAASGNFVGKYLNIGASTTGVVSCFVKQANKRYAILGTDNSTYSCIFDLQTGTVSSEATNYTAKIENYGNGWYRISAAYTDSAAAPYPFIGVADSTNGSVTKDGTNGLFIWGFQYELNASYPTSYIPTSGSTVTRTADVCNNAGTSATFNDSEGVLFFEGSLLDVSENDKRISISDGLSVENRITLRFLDDNELSVQIGFTNGFNETLTLSESNNKIAVVYDSTNASVFINGVKLVTNTMSSLSGLSQLQFNRFGGTSNDFYGKTKQLMYFDEALSDEELSDLTGQVNLSFNNLATFYNYTIL